MQKLKNVYHAYEAANEYLANEESRAAMDDRLRLLRVRLAGRAANSAKMTFREIWAAKRTVNDQAYFIMLFAQLEGRINDLCKKLIQYKRSLQSW